MRLFGQEDERSPLCVLVHHQLLHEKEDPLFFARMQRKEMIISSCSAFFWALAAVGPLALKVSDGQIHGDFFSRTPLKNLEVSEELNMISTLR